MTFAPEDVGSQEAGAAKARKDLEPIPIKQMRCNTINICFDKRVDEKTLRKWMGAHRLTYNAAVELQIETRAPRPAYLTRTAELYDHFRFASVDMPMRIS